MMSLWLGLRSITWLPYVAALLAVLGLGWYIYDSGYDNGYNASQVIVEAAETARLQKTVKVGQAVAKSDLEAVVVTATRKETIRYAYRNIVRTVDTCDSVDWLREYNEAVRAAGTGASASGPDA